MPFSFECKSLEENINCIGLGISEDLNQLLPTGRILGIAALTQAVEGFEWSTGKPGFLEKQLTSTVFSPVVSVTEGHVRGRGYRAH